MIAGGSIAYFGDRLGYAMGKKRVSLFGLRPRHTATVLTVTAGVIIGGLALAFLVGVNRAFREALFSGEAEIRLNLHLMRNNKLLRSEADTSRLAAITAELSANVAQVQSQRARAVLAAAELNLISEQKKTTATRQQLLLKQAALTKLTTDLNNARQQLTAIQAAIVTAEARSKEDVKTRRNGDLIFRNFGELGRTVIAASSTPQEIRGDLVKFLDRLSQTADVQGASIGSNGRAVVVASIELLEQTNNTKGAFIDENGSLDALSASIHSYKHGSGSVVVIATAFGNSFNGEQVIIILRPYANVLAFRAGSEIAETVISPSPTGVDDVVGQLQGFLITQVRPAAIRAGMIPVRNPQTGKVELGEITVEQIYDVVNQIKQINGPAVVTASAVDNVFSADQLKLAFTVRPETPVAN